MAARYSTATTTTSSGKATKAASDTTTTTTNTCLVGTNQSLEKEYLRLTTFPRPEAVRPLPVLKRALVHIQRRYYQSSCCDDIDRNDDTTNTTSSTFEWCNEQLKSIRQDLTVQAIRNSSFVLDVYETHARILLEHGDLNEFNQCQCNIQAYTDTSHLTATTVAAPSNMNDGFTPSSISSSNSDCDGALRQSPKSSAEFRGYAILYSLVQKATLDLNVQLQKYYYHNRNNNNHPNRDAMSRNINKTKKKKKRKVISSDPTNANGNNQHHTMEERDEFGCQEHALSVVWAVHSNNFVAFFKLYATAPHMSVYLMDFLLHRVRLAAYATLLAAVRPTAPLDLCARWLGFGPQHEEARQFLRSQGAVFVPTPTRHDGNLGATAATNTASDSDESTANAELLIDCRQSKLALDSR